MSGGDSISMKPSKYFKYEGRTKDYTWLRDLSDKMIWQAAGFYSTLQKIIEKQKLTGKSTLSFCVCCITISLYDTIWQVSL